MGYARFSVCRIGLPLLFAATAAAWTAPSLADMIDVSLNVFYADPMDNMSGGTWDLVARSDLSGIAGLSLRLTNITSAQPTGPRGTVNGSDLAGFSQFAHVSAGGIHNVIVGQAPIPNAQLGAGEEQTVFYGVGTLTNGSPNYAGQPMGTNSIGPMFTSLMDVLNVPWADAFTMDPMDPFSQPPWDTAARLVTGTFGTGVTPGFASGSNGTIFTATGTTSEYGVISDFIPLMPGINAIVRTNFTFHRADYNQDGTVNAADYTVWRNTLGSTTILDADGSGPMGVPNGVIDIFDYEYWKANYGFVSPGSGSGTALGSATVPEPGTAWLLVAGLAWLALWRAGRPPHAPFLPSRVVGSAELAAGLKAGLPSGPRRAGHRAGLFPGWASPGRAGGRRPLGKPAFCRRNGQFPGSYEKSDFRGGNCLTAWKWANIMPQGSARMCILPIEATFAPTGFVMVCERFLERSARGHGVGWPRAEASAIWQTCRCEVSQI